MPHYFINGIIEKGQCWRHGPEFVQGFYSPHPCWRSDCLCSKPVLLLYSHLTLQQTAGRTVWVAEGPQGGLARSLCSIAPKLHLCWDPQPWPLPELCCRYDHAWPDPNLLTQLLGSTWDLSGYCRPAQWSQDSWLTVVTITGPALLFLLTCFREVPFSARAHYSVHLVAFSIMWGEWRQWRSERATTAAELPQAGQQRLDQDSSPEAKGLLSWRLGTGTTATLHGRRTRARA